jgi:hypothetical protein
MQEVFHLATQKVRPDPDALERQYREQRRHVAKQKVAVFAVIAAVVVAGGVFAITTLRSNDRTTGTGTPGTSVAPTTTTPTVTGGALEPGRYVVRTLDRDFDASYRIRVEVPDGYEGSDEGFAVFRRASTGQMAVSAWIIGDIYGDACKWGSTLLDRSAVSSVDTLVAALASQRGVRVSTPTDVMIDGYAGKYMERTVPAETNLDECNGAEFRLWVGTDGGHRFVDPGQRDRLWIIDVDGVPLVIDASLGGAGTSSQARAEHTRIAESVRIDPV